MPVISPDDIFVKPLLGSQVDYGNPISAGLWCNYMFNEAGGKECLDSGNYQSGVLSFTGTDPVWGQFGLQVGNGKGYVANNKTVLSTFNPVRGSHTVRVLHIPRSWTSGYTALLDVAGSVGSGRILNIFCDGSGNISYRGIGGADGGASANSSGQQLGQVNDLVWVREMGDGTAGSTVTHYWYLNGILFLTEQGFTNNAWPTDGYNFAVGGNPTTGGSAYDGEYLAVQCWDRGLQPHEIAFLAADPYGLMAEGAYRITGKVPGFDIYRTAGTYTWNSGSNTTALVKVTGGGGASGVATSLDTKNSAPGGGGGGCSTKTVTVVPFTNYTVVVGAGGATLGTAGGDSYFDTNTNCMAKGGGAGSDRTSINTGGVGGAASSGFGDTKKSGGNGGVGSSSAKTPEGGGGGGSGGFAANGNNGADGLGNGVPAAGGAAVTGGGKGGDSGYGAPTAAQSGSAPGGGGGGVTALNTTGGLGADGQVLIYAPAPVTTSSRRDRSCIGMFSN